MFHSFLPSDQSDSVFCLQFWVNLLHYSVELWISSTQIKSCMEIKNFSNGFVWTWAAWLDISSRLFLSRLLLRMFKYHRWLICILEHSDIKHKLLFISTQVYKTYKAISWFRAPEDCALLLHKPTKTLYLLCKFQNWTQREVF